MASKFQKMQKHTELQFEVRKVWQQPVTVLPVILGASFLTNSLKLLGVYVTGSAKTGHNDIFFKFLFIKYL